MSTNLGTLRLKFLSATTENNAIISPEGHDGTHFTIIGCGDDAEQNALAEQIVASVNGGQGNVPEGWQLVPKVPILSMLISEPDTTTDQAKACWKSMLAAAPTPPSSPGNVEGSPLLERAVDQWKAQVKHRPLVNVHRRSLDDVWRQVIRWAGGDPVALVGLSHDELLAAHDATLLAAAHPTSSEGGVDHD